MTKFIKGIHLLKPMQSNQIFFVEYLSNSDFWLVRSLLEEVENETTVFK